MPISRIYTAAAGLTLAIAIVAIGITAANRSLTRKAASRQQSINQAVVWGQIDQRLANALGVLAQRDNDARIRQLLEDHGITLRTKPAAATPTTPAPSRTQ